MAPNVPFLLWLLVYPALGLELQPSETGSANQPECEELTTSLAVNQLAILQLMRDGSHASSDARVEESLRLIHLLEAEHLNLRGEINKAQQDILKMQQAGEAGEQRCSQDTVDALRDEINNAKQETLAGMAENEARQQEAAAARDEKIEEILKRLQEDEQRRSQETVEAITASTQATQRLQQALQTGLRAILENVTQETVTTCPDGWLRHESSCYLVGDTERTWENSLAYCRSRGGDLAKITSAEEQQFITAHWNTQWGYWIGLNDRATQGRFVWTDGTSPTYTRWGGGEPGGGAREDCVLMYSGDDYKWHDVSCSGTRTVVAVCERPAHA